tara:strand:- start:290 stop:1099 length:810 start_codon:yes stop_codon:yes gene_type:complete
MINLTEQIQIPLEGNFTLKDIPFIGEMKFVPTIIEWKGTNPNPLIGNNKTKPLKHYLSNSKPTKTKKAISKIFNTQPDLENEENLNLPLGIFISNLKQDNNPLYKTLLNSGGDEVDYVRFKAENLTKEMGIYIWVIDNEPVYVGIASSPSGLYSRINNEYGNITLANCNINGQSQTCGTNSKLRDSYKAKKNISLYVCPINSQKFLDNPKFVEYLNKTFKVKDPLNPKPKNALEVFEKYLIKKYGFKEVWNKRLEESFVSRFKVLAGIK